LTNQVEYKEGSLGKIEPEFTNLNQLTFDLDNPKIKNNYNKKGNKTVIKDPS
jgi:hypothetical protein